MITRRIFLMLATVLITLSILLVSCAPQVEPTPDPGIIATLEALEEKRLSREKELASMDVSQIVQELRQESKRGVEQFNSMPYKEIIARGDEVGPELSKLLTEADRTSILGLLALRQVDKERYSKLDPDFRINVLIDTLATSRTFNIWGLPHLYWEDAAMALMDEGREALELLRPIIDDTREAPMWGSEEVLESQAYSYRVRDYAWAISIMILGEEIEIPTSPEARDKLINEIFNR